MAVAARTSEDIEDRSSDQAISLYDLPNEILVHILEHFQTQPLLHFRTVSHRFQNLIIRIIHARLLRAASLDDRKLILECYHPSARLTEAYLYCDYLGTPGLSDDTEGEGSVYETSGTTTGQGTLRKLYSHFRPVHGDSEPRSYRSHPAGDVPGTRTYELDNTVSRDRETEVVKRIVSLEAHERFSQLCFSAGLVQVGPHRSFFLSNVEAVEKKTFRIFRHWLAETAKASANVNSGGFNDIPVDLSDVQGSNSNGSARLVWIDTQQIAGLRVRVKERKWTKDVPILIHQDEDQAVAYSLELEELLLSTTHLMLAVERSLLETEQTSDKAMIFASFPVTQNLHQTDTPS